MLGASANAADWPSKNDGLTIVVPFKSGGELLTGVYFFVISQYPPSMLMAVLGPFGTVVNKTWSVCFTSLAN